MIRWVLILIIISGLAVGGVTLYLRQQAQTYACTDCDVILISLGHIGAKQSSVYEPEAQTTPYQAQLARRAIVFQNAYTQSPVRLPAIVSYMTGRYPWELGVWQPSEAVPASPRLLAEALTEHGYNTAAVVNGVEYDRVKGFERGFATYLNREEITYPANDIARVFEEARHWLATHEDTPQPLFLYIAPDPQITGSITGESVRAAHLRPEGMTTEEQAAFIAEYRKLILEGDAEISRLVEQIQASTRAKRTMIVITAYTGEEFGEHGVTGVVGGTLYREVLQVPLMIVLPSHTGKRVLATVETRSIPSTVLEMTGVRADPAFEGPSLVPLMRGSETQNRIALAQTAFDRTSMFGTTALRHPQAVSKSAVSGPIHAIYHTDGRRELYALETDPTEQKNLLTSDAPPLPYELERLANRLFAILTLPISF